VICDSLIANQLWRTTLIFLPLGGAVGATVGGSFGAVIGSWIEDTFFSSDKPRGCPTGTKPIDKTKYKKHHRQIKKGVGVGAADWTGISPDGHVITDDGEGNAEDNGPADDYLPGGQK
jgi:hypothetical protein